jgi:hypothetical protein
LGDHHIRKQVRDAAKADLTGLPITGANVFSGRVSGIGQEELPCLNIFILDEDAAFDSVPNIARTGRLVVEGRAQGNDELIDTLDQIAAEVEARAYGSTPALNDLLQNIDAPRTQIELLEPAQGVARRTGIIRILIPVTYRTAISDPTTKV